MDAETEESRSAKERYWRGNLLGAALTVFLVSFGAFMANPLLAVFLHKELGMEDPRELAFWAGLTASLGPLMTGVAAPLWGLIGDRVSRRDMLTRAVAGAAIFAASVGLVQNVLQLVLARSASGLVSGVNPGALALVASETPPQHLSRALGILSSSRSLAMSLGPALGGVAGSILPIRAVYAIAGAVMLAGVVPILLKVHETTRIVRGQHRTSAREALRAAGPGTRAAVVTLLGTQTLAHAAFAGAQTLLVVRMIELEPQAAALAGGLAFAAISLAGVVAGALYPGALGIGFRPLGTIAMLILAAAIVGLAHAVAVPVIIGAAAVAGIGYGIHTPATQSMLGLETPNAIKSTVFGLSSSGHSFGVAGGAIGGGLVAAAVGPTGALDAIAVTAVASALVLWIWGREPRAATAAEPARP